MRDKGIKTESAGEIAHLIKKWFVHKLICQRIIEDVIFAVLKTLWCITFVYVKNVFFLNFKSFQAKKKCTDN